MEMSKRPVYMDYAATTPVSDAVLLAMIPWMTQQFGNPSSLHTYGRLAKKALLQAKDDIAQFIGATDTQEIVLCSGATEANNLAIQGVAQYYQEQTGSAGHIISSVIEHPAVLDVFMALQKKGWQITLLPCDAEGFISVSSLQQALKPETVLVSLMHVNNEIGSIQSIKEFARVSKAHGAVFHTDAVQGLGKVDLDVSSLGIDLLSCSAHKLYGPKGTGFLYVRQGCPLTPLFYGGGQQLNMRSGTENTAGAIGMASALKEYRQKWKTSEKQLQAFSTQLAKGIQQLTPTARLNGPALDDPRRMAGYVNFSFPPLEGEALVLRLDLAGIFVSSGSACHSSQLEGSHVIRALEPAHVARSKSSLRFSLGLETTRADVDRVLTALPLILEQLGKRALTSTLEPLQ
jgi:cysteine desulfurase